MLVYFLTLPRVNVLPDLSLLQFVLLLLLQLGPDCLGLLHDADVLREDVQVDLLSTVNNYSVLKFSNYGNKR